MPQEIARPSPLRVALALLAVYVVWGSTYYAIRVSLESFPPLLMAGARFVVAGALLFAFLRVRGTPTPRPREWGGAALVGSLLLTIGNGAVVVAEQHVSSSLAAVVVATMPLCAVLIGTFFGERPGRAELGGVLIGFGGVVLLNLGGDLSGHPASTAFLLVAPVSWALGSVVARKVALPAGPMASAAQMLCGGASMLVLGVLRGERVPDTASVRAVVAVAYLVVFGSLVAFSAYNYLLRNTRPAIATSYAYVNPLVAILLGTMLGGERIGVLTLAGTAVILTGVLLLRRKGKAKAAEAQQEPAAATVRTPASTPTPRPT